MPAVAQDALPLVGGVAQPVATSNTDAVGLAPPLPSDRVDLVADETQASLTNPGDQTQGPSLSDAASARMAAEADAKRDVSRTTWILFGVFAPYAAPVVAYAVPHDPPATRLSGKTPEYTAFYVETWKDRSKARRAKHAWIGVGIFAGIAIASLTAYCGGSCQ